LASMGRTGGFTERCTLHVIAATFAGRVGWR
jgi:hypothetical protein